MSESDGYMRVASLADVPDGGCLAVECDGRPIVLVRRGEVVTALDNACPHAGAPLSEGFVEGDVITCSWHGWCFDVESGESKDQPGMSIASYPVRLDREGVSIKV